MDTDYFQLVTLKFECLFKTFFFYFASATLFSIPYSSHSSVLVLFHFRPCSIIPFISTNKNKFMLSFCSPCVCFHFHFNFSSYKQKKFLVKKINHFSTEMVSWWGNNIIYCIKVSSSHTTSSMSYLDQSTVHSFRKPYGIRHILHIWIQNKNT